MPIMNTDGGINKQPEENNISLVEKDNIKQNTLEYEEVYNDCLVEKEVHTIIQTPNTCTNTKTDYDDDDNDSNNNNSNENNEEDDTEIQTTTDTITKEIKDKHDAQYEKYRPNKIKSKDIISQCGGNIQKKILQEGKGEKPVPNSSISIHYIGKQLSNGHIFDSSIERNEPFEFILGKKEVIQGWEIVIPTMRCGEIAEVIISPLYAYADLGIEPDIPPHATLIYQIELLNWEPLRTKLDEGIDKVYIKKGSGWELPSAPTICTVDIVGRIMNEDGNIFLNLYDIKIDINDLYLTQGLEIALCSMKPNEISHFYISYEMGGDGYLPDQHIISIPPGSDLFYKITMKDFTCTKQHWEMEIDEKLKIAALLKESGNTFFHSNQLQRAQHRYTLANDMFIFDLDGTTITNPTIDDTTTTASVNENKSTSYNEEISEMMIACQSNIIAVKQKLKAYKEALEACDMLLKISPNHVKTLYRKAKAQSYLQQIDEALRTLEVCIYKPYIVYYNYFFHFILFFCTVCQHFTMSKEF